MTNSTTARHSRRIAAAGPPIVGLLALVVLAGCASSRGRHWAQLTPTIHTESRSPVFELGVRDPSTVDGVVVDVD